MEIAWKILKNFLVFDRKLNCNKYLTNLFDKTSKKISTCINFSIYTRNTRMTFNECLFYMSVCLMSFSLNETQWNTNQLNQWIREKGT